MKHANISMPALISVHRKIEDTLLSLKVNIDTEVSVQYEVDAEHGRDKRCKHLRARLCFNSENYEGNVFASSKLCSQCTLAAVPLCKVREMKIPASKLKLGPADPSKVYGAGLRNSIRGVEGAKTVLANLFTDCNLRKIDVVIIVDLNPGPVAEWGHASWALSTLHASGSDNPSVAWLGFCDPADKVDLNGTFIESLMSDWWDNSDKAGPREPTLSPTGMVRAPELEVVSLDASNSVVVADVLKDRFLTDEICIQWKELLRLFQDAMKAKMLLAGIDASAGAGAPGVANASENQCAPHVTGPDWSVPDFKAEPKFVELPKVASADFDATKILYKVRAQRGLPEMLITVDFAVYMRLDESHNSSPMEMGPCEIWGFNTGDWNTDDHAKIIGGHACFLTTPAPDPTCSSSTASAQQQRQRQRLQQQQHHPQ